MSVQPDPESEASRRSERHRIATILWQFALVVLLAAAFGTLLLMIDRGNAPKVALIGMGVIVLTCAWAIAVGNSITRPFAMLPYMLIVGPLKFRSRRFCFPGTVERISDLPPEIAPKTSAALLDYRAALEREGFRSSGMLLMSGPSHKGLDGSPEQMVVEGFEHLTRRHGAAVLLFVSTQPTFQPRPILRFLERLPDDTYIVTFNSPTPSIHPTLPNRHVLQLPWITDVSELYGVHRRMLARFAPVYTPTGPAPKGWEAAILDENARSGEVWVKQRWVVPAERPGYFRATPYWTIRAAWGLTRPIVGVRRWLLQRRNERLLLRLLDQIPHQ